MSARRALVIARDAGEIIAALLAEVVRGVMARPPAERDAYVAKAIRRSMARFVAIAGPDRDAVDVAHELREFGHRLAEREVRRRTAADGLV